MNNPFWVAALVVQQPRITIERWVFPKDGSPGIKEVRVADPCGIPTVQSFEVWYGGDNIDYVKELNNRGFSVRHGNPNRDMYILLGPYATHQIAVQIADLLNQQRRPTGYRRYTNEHTTRNH